MIERMPQEETTGMSHKVESRALLRLYGHFALKIIQIFDTKDFGNNRYV
jgi:hypothetical protein